MLRKLLIVFASGVILSIIAFGAAWIVGGDRVRQEVTSNNGWSWTFDGDDEHHAKGPRKTRDFTIESGSQIAMEVPVELDFVRGEKAAMTVDGPADIVDRLVWNNGRLSVEGSYKTRGSIKVRITAPEIGGLDLDAPGEVTLAGLDQRSLMLTSRGAIDLDASGKVESVTVKSEGAGNIDLGKLAARDATVRVDGAGDVSINADGTVDVQINGVGNVSLKRKPAVLRSRLNGIGNIDHDY